MTYEDVFKELDLAARANLSAKGVTSYEFYKRELVVDATPPEDTGAILRGFIWDESESEAFAELEAGHGPDWATKV